MATTTRSERRGGSGWIGLVLVMTACAGPTPMGASSRANRVDAERDARTFASKGRHSAAAAKFRVAAHQAQLRGDGERQARFLLEAGEESLRAGDDRAARVALTESLHVAPRIQSGQARRRHILRTRTGLGDVDLRAGIYNNASIQYQEALRYAGGPARDSLLLRLALLEDAAGSPDRADSWRRRVLRPDPETERRLARALICASPGSLQPAPEFAPGVAMPRVHPRSTWGAVRATSDTRPMGRIWRATVHHTAVRTTSTDAGQVARALRGFQRTHVETNKWADIGYHYLIDRAGRVWEGRALLTQGAHAGSPDLNRGNVGVCLLGDFTVQSPSPSQAWALQSLLSGLGEEHAIRRIHTHREIRPAGTLCPGPSLQSLVDRLRGGPLAHLAPAGTWSRVASSPRGGLGGLDCECHAHQPRWAVRSSRGDGPTEWRAATYLGEITALRPRWRSTWRRARRVRGALRPRGTGRRGPGRTCTARTTTAAGS